MAHHANDLPFQDGEQFKKLLDGLGLNSMSDKEKNPLDLGPTGRYPNGKIADNDEGEIQIGITSLKGRIVFDFGKPIRTVGLTPEQAIGIAEVLLKRAAEIQLP